MRGIDSDTVPRRRREVSGPFRIVAGAEYGAITPSPALWSRASDIVFSALPQAASLSNPLGSLAGAGGGAAGSRAVCLDKSTAQIGGRFRTAALVERM